MSITLAQTVVELGPVASGKLDGIASAVEVSTYASLTNATWLESIWSYLTIIDETSRNLYTIVAELLSVGRILAALACVAAGWALAGAWGFGNFLRSK